MVKVAETLTYKDRIEALESVRQTLNSYLNSPKNCWTAQQAIQWLIEGHAGWCGPDTPKIECGTKGIMARSSDWKREGLIPWREFWIYLERCESGQMSLFGEAV